MYGFFSQKLLILAKKITLGFQVLYIHYKGRKAICQIWLFLIKTATFFPLYILRLQK